MKNWVSFKEPEVENWLKGLWSEEMMRDFIYIGQCHNWFLVKKKLLCKIKHKLKIAKANRPLTQRCIYDLVFNHNISVLYNLTDEEKGWLDA